MHAPAWVTPAVGGRPVGVRAGARRHAVCARARWGRRPARTPPPRPPRRAGAARASAPQAVCSAPARATAGCPTATARAAARRPTWAGATSSESPLCTTPVRRARRGGAPRGRAAAKQCCSRCKPAASRHAHRKPSLKVYKLLIYKLTRPPPRTVMGYYTEAECRNQAKA